MTDKQKKLLKLLCELKNDNKISFEEYFDLVECVVDEKKIEYIPITYPQWPDSTSPWISPWYYHTTTSDSIIVDDCRNICYIEND